MTTMLARMSLGLFALLPAALAAQEPLPLEAYGDLSGIEEVTISPGGSRIAIAAQIEGARQIILLNAQSRLDWTIGAEGIKFRGLQFIGEDGLLVYRSNTVEAVGFTADQYEMTQALAFNLAERSAPQAVFGGVRRLNAAVHGSFGVRHTPEGWRGYFGALEYRSGLRGEWVFDHGRPALYAVNFADMDTERVANSPPENFYRDWLLDASGDVAATFNINRNSGAWSIRNASGTEIASGTNPNGDAGLIGLSEDALSVLHSTEDLASGFTQWFSTPLAGGASVPFLEDEDVERLYWNHVTGALMGYRLDSSPPRVVFANPAHQRAARAALAAFPGRNPELIDWTSDMSKLVVHTSGNEDSGSWYLVDIAAGRADELGVDRPMITADKVGPISSVSYTAGDGLALDGVLTLPPGREALGLPLVVLPHGGPHAHDEVTFDWWAQAFASRGYAVFQPNFRGSTGRSEEFERAGYGEWGRKMQSDISDGVDHLAAEGIIDPARACIVGASYGGYAALAGVTVEQGRYRCAVAVAGVSDIELMVTTDRRESGRSRLLRRSLDEELGPRDRWDAVSPRRLAARADAPILLIHGRDDTVVPFEQSRVMADALRDAGKPTRLVELDGEDHWLSLGETRLTMLRETVAFVAEHNPAN